MAFDQPTRNRLARFVSDARSLLTEEFTRQLQHEYGIDPSNGGVTPLDRLTALDDARRETARILRETISYYQSQSQEKPVVVIDRILREQAFTVLNRLCALRMAEARGIILEAVAQGYKSKGFQLYARLAGSALGETGDTYRIFLFSLFDELAVELPPLFDRFSPQGRLFPREGALLRLLELLNDPEMETLWSEDETIGWIYQYFNSKEERKAMRDASQAPRNSRELAVRNQFFTPRYVVEFLTDNTLGRIWYEMTRGETSLKDNCRYLVRRPNEIFLNEGEEAPQQPETGDSLSQEELLRLPVYIPHRPLKDPRELKMLDPACGSMHFGLYAFDLFEQIYAEAWELEESLGAGALWRLADLEPLHQAYPNREAFLRDVPRLIIERNIHGIDIDPRAVQIAGLSLWLRAQRSWQTQDVMTGERPTIHRSNIVCAEPMPGDRAMLEEFLAELDAGRLEALLQAALPGGRQSQRPLRATPAMSEALKKLVRTVWQEMELAGEAGSLLKIEETLQMAVAAARKASEEKTPLLRVLEFGLQEDEPGETTALDFWALAEVVTLAALRSYAEHAAAGQNYRRRLFAGDAVQGFAFIDLCRKRYDTVLMNPPFGLAPPMAFDYARKSYPYSYTELLASFVERGRILSIGRLGAITSRSFMVASRLRDWRSEIVCKHICLLADLGDNVMDNAFVEASAYVIDVNPIPTLLSFDCRKALQPVSQSLFKKVNFISSEKVFQVPSSLFLQLPNNRIVYAIDPQIAYLIKNNSSFEPKAGTARQGLATWNDFRFVRLFWEVKPNDIGKEKVWLFLSKGGAYSRYMSNIHLIMNWNKNGAESRAINISKNGTDAQARQASDYWHRPGLTYSIRSQKGFSARFLPKDCLFTGQGPLIVSESTVSNIYLLAACRRCKLSIKW